MPNAADILWFKQNFQSDIQQAITGTAFTVDFMVAIACQETGDVWPILRKKPISVDQVVALCVGDTLDSDKGRKAFPKTKADLLGKPNGAGHVRDRAASVAGHGAAGARLRRRGGQSE